MKGLVHFFFAAALLAACDQTRVYEKNIDFEQGAWLVGNKPEFTFNIADTNATYNLYCNFRNTLNYPYSRLFVTYYLQDSTGKVSRQKMVSKMIFDPRTGKPEGSSGLGDIYDHKILLIQGYKFRYRGPHAIKFEQLMRSDTLAGILAVGVRVEKNLAEN
jgi:gliding motility-associated lipoprotein GldH